ncbi:hypothetical protein [Natronococcus amylolyticus]|nr:hypothetical protein [Natronococcus amylolyticus]
MSTRRRRSTAAADSFAGSAGSSAFDRSALAILEERTVTILGE